MKPHVLSVILAACLVAAAPSAFPQTSRGADAYLKRLQSDSIEQRTQAAEDIYGAGLSSKEVYDQLAANIQAGLAGIDKKSPRLEEMAWSVKALGSSGDRSYLPVIESATRTGIGYLVRHSKNAKETLEQAAANGKPYLEFTKVRVISERQAEQCEYVTQNDCKTSRSPQACIEFHKVKAAEADANSIVMLFSSTQTGGLNMWGASTSMTASYYTCP